jgi:hypothetical protein
MHVVVAAWLFVIFTMALTLSSAWIGVAFFTFVGLGPVVLLVLLAARRRRVRAADASVSEQNVHAADDGDPEANQ